MPGSCVSVSSSLNTTSASSGQADYYEAGCFPLVLAKLAGDVLMVLGRYYLVHLLPVCLQCERFFPNFPILKRCLTEQPTVMPITMD